MTRLSSLVQTLQILLSINDNILILFLLDSSCTETLFRIRMYDFLIVCAYDGSKVSMISLLPTFIFITSLQPFVVLYILIKHGKQYNSL